VRACEAPTPVCPCSVRERPPKWANSSRVYAALSYYHENPQEIDADLERDREAGDRIEADRADFMSR
jgi:hypothetical protein